MLYIYTYICVHSHIGAARMTAGVQFPGFRRDFFRVPVSVCVLFGCIAGQKPTRRRSAFALIQRFRRNKMSIWAEKTEELTSPPPPPPSSSS